MLVNRIAQRCIDSPRSILLATGTQEWKSPRLFPNFAANPSRKLALKTLNLSTKRSVLSATKNGHAASPWIAFAFAANGRRKKEVDIASGIIISPSPPPPPPPLDGWMDGGDAKSCLSACFSRNVQNPDGISSTLSLLQSNAIGYHEAHFDVVWSGRHRQQMGRTTGERAKCKRNKLHVTLHGEENPERREERGG